MTAWRFIDSNAPARGAWNMAVDEVLFRGAEEERAGGPVLRLYAWEPACLSIGYHQDMSKACDAAYCESRGYDVVRRPTGGKAVLHADEVTYSVTAPFDAPPFAGLGLVETYGLIADALASGLEILGLDVSLNQRPLRSSPKVTAPCFVAPSEKEILVGGRKVVGSAQRRGERAFLQHGAVPLTINYEELGRATGQAVFDPEAYRSAFAGLGDFEPGLTAEAVRAALRRGFEEVFEGPWSEAGLTAQETGEARRLVDERYGTKAWNFKRGRADGSRLHVGSAG